MKTLKIAVDSREQNPHHQYQDQIINGVQIKYEPLGLDIFDYALIDDCEEVPKHKLHKVGFSVERKSHEDFMGSFFNGANTKREMSKIAKAKERFNGQPICYVIEADHEAIKHYDYSRHWSGRISPKVVLAKIRDLRWMGVHCLLCKNKMIAEYEVINLLKRRWREINKKSSKKV